MIRNALESVAIAAFSDNGNKITVLVTKPLNENVIAQNNQIEII